MNARITSFFIVYPITFFLVIIGLAFLAIPSVFAQKLSILENEMQKSHDELLVKFVGLGELIRIKIAEKETFQDYLSAYNNNPLVEYAEPNYFYQASQATNDVYYDNQWYLTKIKADKAWPKITKQVSLVIAIIDSGIQISHPDLKNNIWINSDEIYNNNIDDDKNGFIDDYQGWDFISNSPDPSPRFDEGFTEAGVLHGTIVAGIASAGNNNGQGIAGIGLNSKIMPLRVLNDKGEGRTSEVIRAIDYATKNGADVINLSFVGLGYSQGLYEAIKRAYNAGIIIVAAAGNEYHEGEGYNLDSIPMYPVCHDGTGGENMIIGVAATDSLDQKADFSSYGNNCVDILAPGVSIFSTSVYMPTKSIAGKYFNSYYDGYWSGTSMATPMVSGAITLIEQANPFISREKVIEILLQSADNVNKLNSSYLGKIGHGRLNIEKAMDKAVLEIGLFETNLIIAPAKNYESKVKITDINGKIKTEFFAHSSTFRGGVNVAAGDLDGDGKDEIITGAGVGGGPQVRIFNESGKNLGQFFAYSSTFRGGVNVAAGDLDGDGKDEIITGAGVGGGPQVRIFNESGKNLGQFTVYSSTFRGGVNVAAGDLDGDGKDEIITGAGVGGGPQVRIFNESGKNLGQFFAYNSAFRGGVKVACGNIDAGSRNFGEEIITSPGPGGGPHLKIFDNNAKLKGEFFAFGDKYSGGVNVAAGDLDNDGSAEIVAGTGPEGIPYVRSFNPDGKFFASFYAFPEEQPIGVNVAVLNKKIK